MLDRNLPTTPSTALLDRIAARKTPNLSLDQREVALMLATAAAGFEKLACERPECDTCSEFVRTWYELLTSLDQIYQDLVMGSIGIEGGLMPREARERVR